MSDNTSLAILPKCNVPINKVIQDGVTPDTALQALMNGNKRFVEGTLCQDRSKDTYIKDTSGGQWPIASVLCCIDSRVPAETIFDQYIGDIFVARVAGNFVNTDILGSLEYATAVANSKLIMVMGHTGCGAVKSACMRLEPADSNITALLANILPAVDAVEERMVNNPADPKFTNEVARTNVRMTIGNMLKDSPMIRDMANNGTVKIVGAMYDVSTGAVTLL